MADYKTVKISNPGGEYTSLCYLLFNRVDAGCHQIDQSARSQILPAKDAGLFAYQAGIFKGLDGYSYQEAERLYGDRLRKLQGASVYLLGTGTCRVGSDDSACFTATSKAPVLKYDFVDDMFNLVGAFELFREKGSRGKSMSTCEMSAATFGAKGSATQFCGYFYSHNILMTPYSLQVRGVPEYYKSHHKGRLEYPMSICQ